MTTYWLILLAGLVTGVVIRLIVDHVRNHNKQQNLRRKHD